MTFSKLYTSLMVTAATGIVTVATGILLVQLIHTHHTMQTKPVPMKDPAVNSRLIQVSQSWLYLHPIQKFSLTIPMDTSLTIGPTMHESEARNPSLQTLSQSTKSKSSSDQSKNQPSLRHQPATKTPAKKAKPTADTKSTHAVHKQSRQTAASQATPTQTAKKQTTSTHKADSTKKKRPPGHLPTIAHHSVFGYVPGYAKTVSLNDIEQQTKSYSGAIDWSFSLERTGSVRGTPNSALLSFAKKRGLQVYASISNNYDRALTAHVLSSSAAKDRLAHDLLQLATRYHYTGVNLDLENVSKADRAKFSSFVAQLAATLHSHGKLLTLAVPAIDTASREGGYNLTALGHSSDGLVVMAYDYTFLTQPPGPIAPLAWVQRVLSFNLKHVPAHKLFLGLGAYGYEWGGPKTKAMSEQAADQEVAAKHMIQKESKTHQKYFTYTNTSGDKYTLYYETDTALRQLVHLAQTKQLGGVALWHAGSEDTATATALRQYR